MLQLTASCGRNSWFRRGVYGLSGNLGFQIPTPKTPAETCLAGAAMHSPGPFLLPGLVRFWGSVGMPGSKSWQGK